MTVTILTGDCRDILKTLPSRERALRGHLSRRIGGCGIMAPQWEAAILRVLTALAIKWRTTKHLARSRLVNALVSIAANADCAALAASTANSA